MTDSLGLQQLIVGIKVSDFEKTNKQTSVYTWVCYHTHAGRQSPGYAGKCAKPSEGHLGGLVFSWCLLKE